MRSAEGVIGQEHAGVSGGTIAAGGARVGVRALSRSLSRVINDVTSSGRPAIVTKHGVPIAAVVPIAYVHAAAADLAEATVV